MPVGKDHEIVEVADPSLPSGIGCEYHSPGGPKVPCRTGMGTPEPKPEKAAMTSAPKGEPQNPAPPTKAEKKKAQEPAIPAKAPHHAQPSERLISHEDLNDVVPQVKGAKGEKRRLTAILFT